MREELCCRFYFAAALLAITFFAASATAQNSINGVVFNESRKPVAEIEVELLDEYERLLRYVKTNSSGLYIFAGLRAGVYFINIRVAGTNYKPSKERLQLGEGNRTNRTSGAVTGGETAQINITLETDRRNKFSGVLYNEVVFAQNVPVEAEKFYEEGLKNFEKNKTSEGIAALESAIGIFPDYFLALDYLGKVYLAQGKFAEAEPLFQKAVAVNPKSFSSSYDLGATQYRLQKRDEALKTLEQAIIINPSSINSFFLLGKIHRELKNYVESETNYKKAEALSEGKLADIHWELALLYYHNLNRYADAAKHLELFLKVKPNVANREQIEKLIKQIREKAKQK